MKKFLERHGWREVDRLKQGCFLLVLWLDAKSHQVFRQGDAVQIQRDRNVAAKKGMVTNT
jgi:hypothetical protein